MNQTSVNVYYSFVATESKSYTISSSNASEAVGCKIYNASGEQIGKGEGDPNSDGWEYDFSVPKSLVAGQTYLMEFYLVGWVSGGTFVFIVR